MAFGQLTRFALIALAGIALAGTGCAGGNSKSKQDMTAPEAWKQLKKESDSGSIIGAMASIGAATQGVNVNSGTVSSLFDRELKNANTKVEQALNSDLPSEALRAMVNEIAEFFVVELSQLPDVQASEHQFVLAFGDFQTGGNKQMSAAMDELVARLFENQEIKNNYYVVTTNESDANKFISNVSGGDLSVFRDPLQREAVDPTLPAKFDPRYVYLITGKLDSAKDIPNRSVTISMSMELVKPIARQTVKKPMFVRTYMWHPYRNNWELQP